MNTLIIKCGSDKIEFDIDDYLNISQIILQDKEAPLEVKFFYLETSIKIIKQKIYENHCKC